MSLSGDVQALYPDLAELALQARDQSTFRSAWLNRLAAVFHIEDGSVSSSRDGGTYVMHLFNGSGFSPERLPAYLAELEPRELSLMMTHMTSDELWSAQRRDRMLVFREYMTPCSIVSHVMRAWMRNGYVFLLVLCRKQGASKFEADDLRALEALFPLIALGEGLHAMQERYEEKRSVTDLAALSPAESTVTALAQRGLTDREISVITGTKPKTVGNQLAAAYRKLGVSNRTELAFLLAGIDNDPRAIRGMPLTAIQQLLREHRRNAAP
jgi:DNA-binding CsgD family transcriptional regulator